MTTRTAKASALGQFGDACLTILGLSYLIVGGVNVPLSLSGAEAAPLWLAVGFMAAGVAMMLTGILDARRGRAHS